jgi:hypothetical protein
VTADLVFVVLEPDIERCDVIAIYRTRAEAVRHVASRAHELLLEEHVLHARYEGA